MMIKWALSQHNMDNLISKIRGLDMTKRWEVSIREVRNIRSLEQDNRLWALYRSVSNHLGYTADELHTLMGYKFLREQQVINGNHIETIKSTTRLNTKEMSDYMQQIEIWASQMGWSWEE